MKQFKHACNCGGYARRTTENPFWNPHQSYCKQYEEYKAYIKYLKSKGETNE